MQMHGLGSEWLQSSRRPVTASSVQPIRFRGQSQRIDALAQTSGWTTQHIITKELRVKPVTIAGPRGLGEWWLPGLTLLGMFNGQGDASDLPRLFVLSALTLVSCKEASNQLEFLWGDICLSTDLICSTLFFPAYHSEGCFSSPRLNLLAAVGKQQACSGD